jgi:two-component system, cell cycle response regulator DivK
MSHKSLILLIETDLNELNLINSHLLKLNYSCISAKEGIRGLMLAQNHQPNLIILDVRISDLLAIQVIQYLKQDPDTKKIPIIASLAVNKEQECHLLMIAGANHCVEKPYNLEELEQVVRYYTTRG